MLCLFYVSERISSFYVSKFEGFVGLAHFLSNKMASTACFLLRTKSRRLDKNKEHDIYLNDIKEWKSALLYVRFVRYICYLFADIVF